MYLPFVFSACLCMLLSSPAMLLQHLEAAPRSRYATPGQRHAAHDTARVQRIRFAAIVLSVAV